MFNPVLVTPPVKEPVTVDELKKHSRVTVNAEDDICLDMIQGAVEWSEAFTSRVFVTQTWDIFYDDGFPCHEIVLPRGPHQSLTFIKYIDTNGVQQTLDPSKYQFTANGFIGRLRPAFGETWPICRPQMDSVQVRLVCGYGTEPDDIPRNIRRAVFLLAAHFYQNREALIVGSGVDAKEIPLGVRSLLMGRKKFKV